MARLSKTTRQLSCSSKHDFFLIFRTSSEACIARGDGKVVRQVSGVQKIVFNTDVFPRRERFAAYREELAKWSCGLELSTPDQFDFHANLELRRVGSLNIMINTLSAIEVARTPRLVQDGDDALLVMLLLGGQARQSQLGGQQLINAGQAVIFDSGCPGVFSLVSGSQLLTLKIPRAKLSVRLPHVSRFANATLDGDPVACELLSFYLSSAFDLDLVSSEPTAQLLHDHIIDLVALALRTGGGMQQLDAPAMHRAAILREIEASAADSAFDSSITATRLGITVRYVHHLLEITGRTFSEHLVDRRLKLVEQILRDRLHTPRRIADIAFQNGFRDLSYFNRVFRRKYGAAPSDVRRAAISAAFVKTGQKTSDKNGAHSH
jgi:AraC-like DNA-binding protein